MSIQDKTLHIVSLAMDVTASNNAHVFVNFSGHVNALKVDAHPADSVYKEGDHRPRLIDLTVYLAPNKYRTKQEIITQLDTMIAQLNQLKTQEQAA